MRIYHNSDYRIEKSYWAKNLDYSYSGLAADLDVMVKFGPVFVSAGCNTLNFKYAEITVKISYVGCHNLITITISMVDITFFCLFT